MEYEVVRLLSANAGRIVRHDTLLRRMREGREGADVNRVSMFVRNLRRKLGDSAGAPRRIFNRRGVGYRMAKPGEG